MSPAPPLPAHEYRSLLEAAPALVWRATPGGLCDYFSPSWLAFCGAAPERLLGDGWLDHVHPDDRAGTAARFRAGIDSGAAFELEYRFRRSDGQYRWLIGRAAPLRDPGGALIGFAGACADVQRGHEAVAQRDDANVARLSAEEAQRVAEAAQHVAEEARRTAEEAQARAESIQRQRDEQAQELARSNAELEQFAYVASHDLQEPLRMVASYVQLLARRYQGRLDAEADKFIGYAVDGATRMQRLINDLLVFSRAGTGKHAPIVLHPRQILDQTVADLRTLIGETGAEITADSLPPVLADRHQLGQLFHNLLGNALKFRGPAPPRVRVSATREGRRVAFRVEDNGIGIDPQFFDRIFVIFQRLHGPAKYPGTGIGLALCKKIVERHGGKMWVDSTPGQGSTFHFTLPAADEGQQQGNHE